MRRAWSMIAAVVLGACGGGTPTGVNNPGGGGGGSGGGNTPVATNSVTLQGSAFVPQAIVVSPGATVTFTNADNFAHNVTFANNAITSVENFSSGSRSVTMPTAVATYDYRCTLHAGMTGTVKVQ